MGITIDRKAAEEVFQQALRIARSDAALPEEWIERTDRVAASGNKTFTPAQVPAVGSKDPRMLGIRVFHAFIEPK